MVRTAAADRLLEAAPEDVGISSAGLERVSRLVQRYVDARRIPGGISAVVRRGRLVHFETYGSMNDDAGQEMQPDAIFRIYSMTKPIVSVALMMLYEEGLFMLDDPASKYVPQFKDLRVLVFGGTADNYETREPAREMTVRDLLMHTSGLVSPAGGVVVSTSPVAELYRRAQLGRSVEGNTLEATIDRLGELPLKCDPGSEWNYGISTDVVGYLIEVLSGQRLDDFVRERILDPLGMVDSGFMVPQSQLHRFAANYRHVEGDKYELLDAPAGSAYTKPATYLSGAGGMVSTAADYLRFVKMLANRGELDGVRILGPRTLQLMAMNHLLDGRDLASMNSGGPTESARDGVGFGLGFAVLLDPTQSQTTGTPGEYYWGGAASTAFFVSPAEDLAMVFMTQLMPSSSYPIRRELRNVIYGSITD
jgi:CubicO group peptidase (beta-lactamase class C family)